MFLLKFDWNPITGIDIVGDFKIHFYSLMWIVAFLLGLQIMKRIYKKENVSLEYVDSLFMYTLIATMLGARLGHVIFYEPATFKTDFWSVFLPFQFNPEFKFTGISGLASHGAAIGIIIAMILYRRKYKYKSTLWILDRIVIPVAIGGVFIRLGNFINSEIVGKVTQSNFGVRFIQDYYKTHEHPRNIMNLTGIREPQEAFNAVTDKAEFKHLLDAVPYKHATQIYEAACYVVVFSILWILYSKYKKGQKRGFLFGAFLVLLWTVRFFIEFLKEPQVPTREDYVWFMNTGQLLSVPFILLGFYFMFFYKPKTKA